MSRCEYGQCGNAATTRVCFVSKTNPAEPLNMCNPCLDELNEQYKNMGKPGQISIRPIN